MAHFAKVINGVVENVMVAEQDYIDSLPDADLWIQTSYNTFGGQHFLGGTPLRFNFASIGGLYDAEHDAFYNQQPPDAPSWILNTTTFLWEAPVPVPEFNSETHEPEWDEDKYQAEGDGWTLRELDQE